MSKGVIGLIVVQLGDGRSLEAYLLHSPFFPDISSAENNAPSLVLFICVFLQYSSLCVFVSEPFLHSFIYVFFHC